MDRKRAPGLLTSLAAVAAVSVATYTRPHDRVELANRIPEAPPYETSEARFFPPPYEEYWKTVASPGQCQSCHQRIFDEWRGSMMANAWRDPVWRAAFLLASRQVATDGSCSAPLPPDGTAPARLNPFASSGECATTFDTGAGVARLSRPGSLVDGFCSRCHMPSNYVDNVPLHEVVVDGPSGLEHGRLSVDFNPTSDAGTGIAFAQDERRLQNTESGEAGVFCAICHSIAATRDTPYHTLARGASRRPEYVPARGIASRAQLVPDDADMFKPPDATAPTLGYAIGAGSFRLSPHAIAFPDRFGPLTATRTGSGDEYLEGVFRRPMPYERSDAKGHEGYHNVLLARSELCAGCHDVTNPLTIANHAGKWVGAFPIERTYTEWLGSRYADRPGNRNFDRRYKRDCQTCHMQQDYGQPGTALSLYDDRGPREPLRGPVAQDGAARRYFTHHFVGGNAYVPRAIGAAMDSQGSTGAYPRLSIFSFTSADERSPYHNAYWIDTQSRGVNVQQSRLAWDRLRNVLDLDVTGPAAAVRGTRASLRIRVTNSGSGHKFPTGFPEGRVAWVAVRAFDLGTGRELDIYDSRWNRTSRGVGDLTRETMADPAVPECRWNVPPGSPDPYAAQFKAVATLGDGCPTLDLSYAHASNLIVDRSGRPIDDRGAAIDGKHPTGLPRFADRDGDGDVFDDAFLSDSRLDPLPHAGATRELDRFGVVIPADAAGPVAVTAAVYYQSVEAIAALKLLGNLSDTDQDFRLEPCVLGGLCDGRVPAAEPAVVEGSPPVPMEVRNWLIALSGAPPRGLLSLSTYPPPEAANVQLDPVVKVFVSEPCTGLDASTFTLRDGRGAAVPASVDQIGDGAWGLFPDRVFLNPNETYTARVDGRLCGFDGRCAPTTRTWRFRTAANVDSGTGDTRVPRGFRRSPARVLR